MKIKNQLKIVIFFVILVSIFFSVSINYLLNKYKSAIKDTKISHQTALLVFTRRLIADDYILNGSERAKSQWYAAQSQIKNLLSSNNIIIHNADELSTIENLKTQIRSSEKIFGQLIDLKEKKVVTSSAILNTKEQFLANQLTIRSQETIETIAKLEKINDQESEESLGVIITFFSIAASFFLILLLISFKILWKSASILEKLDKLKDEFLSIASHELRTPMTAIKGYVSMILEGDYGKIDDNLKEPLDSIGQSTERLINLVNDMLNVSRIEAGRLKFNLAESDMKSIINEVVVSLQPIAAQKHIVLKSDINTSSTVQVDPDKVKQMLHNLIGNALKFTDEGSITVTMKEEAQTVLVRIIDTGSGISVEDQAKLFGKFQQISDAQKGKPQGTGLGLYITKQIAQRMGGNVWIEESKVGKGTIFAFTVPKKGTSLALQTKQKIEREALKHPDQK